MTPQEFSTRGMLERLIAFDTTSRDGNIPLIEFVESYLDGWGVPHLRVDYEEGKKTNLYATIGPDAPGGIVLSGHTDVVPVDGQPWATDPFTLVERDGRLYGRGSCDMKGFIAVALAMVPEFKRRSLRTPIHLALSCDEEVGCRGVRPLVAYMQEHLPKPAVVIVGEPTSMKVVNAHKGAHTFTTEVTGHEAHSSCTHLGVNAIMTAAELIGELNRTRQDLIGARRSVGALRPALYHHPCRSHRRRHGEEHHTAALLVHLETRLLPDDDPREVPERFDAAALALEPDMKRISPEAGIKTTFVNAVPGLAPEEDSPAERLALHLAEANGLEAVSYATEAGLFQQIGIPSVICGPGSIEQAHKPDEYVEVSQLNKCENFMRRLADYCAG